MILNVNNLSFRYGATQVLSDVSFSLRTGEFMSVLGPNGAGKTTLFRCILGNLPGYTGTITADGADMRALSHRERAAALAYIPQIHRSVFGYSVADTVMMGISRQLGALTVPKREHLDRVTDALRRVGAEHLKDRDFSKLSGGEQQLVLIARAIAQDSRILVMDEPTSSLDYGNGLRITELIRGLADSGYGVLFSTHNPQQALNFADTVLALKGGAVAACGSPREKLNPALIYDLYGVSAAFADTENGAVIVPVRGENVPLPPGGKTENPPCKEYETD